MLSDRPVLFVDRFGSWKIAVRTVENRTRDVAVQASAAILIDDSKPDWNVLLIAIGGLRFIGPHRPDTGGAIETFADLVEPQLGPKWLLYAPYMGIHSLHATAHRRDRKCERFATRLRMIASASERVETACYDARPWLLIVDDNNAVRTFVAASACRSWLSRRRSVR